MNYLFFYPFHRFLRYGRVFRKYHNAVVLAANLLHDHYFHFFPFLITY